ncbi:MAG: hypothetical protein JNL70_02455 [Saprospiraceae bacterium]|nr:hypothetical protein [Saprospiraceae bacterium]
MSILLLLFAVLNQTFSTIGTLVAFQLNRQYIAEVLCVNKNRPELHCNGKCVLMQRVQNEVDKASEKGQQMLRNLIERDVVVFFETLYFGITKNENKPPQYKPLLNVAYLNRKRQFFSTSIFHPPTEG